MKFGDYISNYTDAFAMKDVIQKQYGSQYKITVKQKGHLYYIDLEPIVGGSPNPQYTYGNVGKEVGENLPVAYEKPKSSYTYDKSPLPTPYQKPPTNPNTIEGEWTEIPKSSASNDNQRQQQKTPYRSKFTEAIGSIKKETPKVPYNAWKFGKEQLHKGISPRPSTNTFTVEGEATAYLNRLKRAGFDDAFIDSKESETFKVYDNKNTLRGSFNNSSQANSLKDQLKKEGVFPYVKAEVSHVYTVHRLSKNLGEKFEKKVANASISNKSMNSFSQRMNQNLNDEMRRNEASKGRSEQFMELPNLQSSHQTQQEQLYSEPMFDRNPMSPPPKKEEEKFVGYEEGQQRMREHMRNTLGM